MNRWVKFGGWISIAPVFIVFEHAFSSIAGYRGLTAEPNMVGFVLSLTDNADFMITSSLGYITTYLVFSVFSFVPQFGSFMGLDDPVIAVSGGVFILCYAVELIKGYDDLTMTKFTIGMFTGTFIKEKLKHLRKRSD